MKVVHVAALMLAAVAGMESDASADSLGVALQYNAFIVHNMTQTSDAEGALAVGGNLTVSSYSIGKKTPATGMNLVVGGNFTAQYGDVWGNAIISGNVDYNDPTIHGTMVVNGSVNFHNAGGSASSPVQYVGKYTGPSYIKHQLLPAPEALPLNFTSMRTDLIQESAALAMLASTGTLADYYHTLTFTGTSSGLNVFTISASELSHAYGVNISLPTGGYAVVNVTGAGAGPGDSIALPNVGFNFSATDVLWNLPGFDSISMGSFKGSILAPEAKVGFAYGNVNGSLVADSLSGGGQLNYYQFSHPSLTGGTTPAVPMSVPLPMGVWAGAAMLACMGAFRFLRRAPA